MKLAGDLFYPEIRHPKMRLWGGGGYGMGCCFVLLIVFCYFVRLVSNSLAQMIISSAETTGNYTMPAMGCTFRQGKHDDMPGQ